jgi:peptidoglycan/xylan/chitin deacetylase (PgdA/CDA1 family)
MIKKVISKYLKRYEIKSIPSEGKVVYLTFDDGPEPGITEFVLEELKKYGFRGTFFCRGDNAENNPDLLSKLREEGHAIANHTYSHLHAYDAPANDYLADVEKADSILHTNLFRPPHGCLTLKTWLGLQKKFRIVYWAINSEDSANEKFNFQHAIGNLKSNTKSGDVVLFHFCHKHQKETQQLLPIYLKWLNDNGYNAEVIK